MFEKLSILDGYQVESASHMQGLQEFIQVSNPDLLVVSVEFLNHEHLALLVRQNASEPLPVVVFARKTQDIDTKSVVSAGVNTYIVGEVVTERLPVVLDLALERFAQMATVNDQLADVKKKLAERKLVERAKGMIMRQRKCTEDQAYKEMRKLSMNQGISMAELASRIISVFDDLLE